MFRKNSHAIYSNSLENSNFLENRTYLKFNPLAYPPVKFNGGFVIFAQNDIKLYCLANQKITLLFGIHVESGVALVNLRESIKPKLDYYDHDLAISETTDKIIMEIHNNGKNDVVVKKGGEFMLCKIYNVNTFSFTL